MKIVKKNTNTNKEEELIAPYDIYVHDKESAIKAMYGIAYEEGGETSTLGVEREEYKAGNLEDIEEWLLNLIEDPKYSDNAIVDFGSKEILYDGGDHFSHDIYTYEIINN